MPLKKLLPLLLTAALFGCQQPDAADPMTLRTYDVPYGQGPQLRGLLNQAFVSNDKAQAKATVTPDGRLIVVGPRRLQDGVANLIDDLKHKNPSPPPTVQIEYWMVLGKPSNGAAAQPSSAPATPDPALNAIRPALNVVQKEDGPQTLTLMEKLQARSLSDENAEAGGSFFDVRQNATVVGGKVLSDVEIRLHGNVAPAGPNHLRTRLELPPGQLVVLGETGFEPSRDAVPGGSHQTLYYVVRATVQGTPGQDAGAQP